MPDMITNGNYTATTFYNNREGSEEGHAMCSKSKGGKQTPNYLLPMWDIKKQSPCTMFSKN